MRTTIADPKTAKALRADNIPRSKLAGIIQSIARKLSREDMSKIVDDAASQCSRLMSGHLLDLSADRMVKWLTRFGCNVTITVSGPAEGKTRSGLRRGKVRVEYLP